MSTSAASSPTAVTAAQEPLPSSCSNPSTSFANASTRVKGIDAHPDHPWMLTALYDGQVMLWDYEAKRVVRTFAAGPEGVHVRCARFVPRQPWVITAADDYHIRVFHLGTGSLLKAFIAHDDYVRSLAVHPTKPLVLSASDDHSVKAWDWSQDWTCMRKFSGHQHYVMSVALNPRNPGMFATASLDREARLWLVSDDAAKQVITGHTTGINAVTFNATGTHLATASDDRTIKIWACSPSATGDAPTMVATLMGHTNNVTCVAFHESRPLLVSGSEDNSVRLWDTNTWQCSAEWKHDMGRAWALAFLSRSTGAVAIGYDRGSMVVDVEQEALSSE